MHILLLNISFVLSFFHETLKTLKIYRTFQYNRFLSPSDEIHDIFSIFKYFFCLVIIIKINYDTSNVSTRLDIRRIKKRECLERLNIEKRRYK